MVGSRWAALNEMVEYVREHPGITPGELRAAVKTGARDFGYGNLWRLEAQGRIRSESLGRGVLKLYALDAAPECRPAAG